MAVGLDHHELEKHVYDYMEEGDSLKILVAGKMGVGKSSLINSIYGAEIAPEETSAAAVTNEIINYTANVPTPYERNQSKESTLTFWDSPGFGDIFAADQEKVIEELKYVVDKAQVLVYCFDIRGRLTRDDADGIIEITKRVSPDIWLNSVFALNFCNKMEHPQGLVDPLQFFAKSFQSWQQQITKTLREKAKVPDRIVEKISIVACGYREQQPPGFRNWYSSFWSTVFEKMREDGQSVLLKLTLNRFIENEPDLSDIEPPVDCHTNPPLSTRNPYELKVALHGDKELPGLVTGSSTPGGHHSPAAVRGTGLPATIPSTAVTGRKGLSPTLPRGKRLSETVSGNRGSSSSSAEVPGNRGPSAAVPGGHHSSPTVPGGKPLSAEDVAVQVDDLLQPRLQSRCDQELMIPPPAAIAPLPPPAQPVEPALRPSTKKAVAKGAATIASSAATGAVIGALVGILGGFIGVGVGAAGGAIVGTTVGVIGLIAFRVGQYIRKKKKLDLEAANVVNV